MTEINGWNVWAHSDGALRKFTVACQDEKDALGLVRRIAKDLHPVSREPLSAALIADLDLGEGQLLEWAPIGRGARISPGGTPLKKPMNR